MRLLVLFFITTAVIIVNFKTAGSLRLTVQEIKNFLKPYVDSCFRKIPIERDIQEEVAQDSSRLHHKRIQYHAGTIPELVYGIKEGIFHDDNESLKCFAKCFMQLMRVMRNGKIVLDSIINQVQATAPEELVEPLKWACQQCAEIISKYNYEDPCETAYYFVKCVYELDNEAFIFL